MLPPCGIRREFLTKVYWRVIAAQRAAIPLKVGAVTKTSAGPVAEGRRPQAEKGPSTPVSAVMDGLKSRSGEGRDFILSEAAVSKGTSGHLNHLCGYRFRRQKLLQRLAAAVERCCRFYRQIVEGKMC